MRHFIQAGRDQPRQADDVRAFLASPVKDGLRGDHHAQVHDVEVVAGGDDVDVLQPGGVDPLLVLEDEAHARSWYARWGKPNGEFRNKTALSEAAKREHGQSQRNEMTEQL